MASLLRWAKRSIRRAPSPPLCFKSSGFEVINASEVLEEERFEEFKKGRYYPVNIGEIFSFRYQLIGKLGFGATSTVWLACDHQAHQHVTLKVYTCEEANREEFEIYKHLNQGSPAHPGYVHVRAALDIFTIPRAGSGDHYCLVQWPMWGSFRDLLSRNPSHRFTEDVLKAGLMQVFLALDYLHTECRLVHTDIKGDNILQEIEDESILENLPKLKWTTLHRENLLMVHQCMLPDG